MKNLLRQHWRKAAILGLVATLILLGGGCLHRGHFCAQRESPSPESAALQAGLRSHITHLAQTIGERNVYRPEKLAAAADWITTKLQSTGNFQITHHGFRVSPEYHLSTVTNAPFATNIIAEKRGNSRADEIIVIGAHYDTVGFSKDWTGDDLSQFRVNSAGTPGANDNASGVAALLELARLLNGSSHARTIRLVAFANEEPPFFQEKDGMGSYLYAQKCRADGDNIVLMISLDTLGVYSFKEPHIKRPWSRSLLLGALGLKAKPDYVAFMSNWEASSGRRARECAKLFAKDSSVDVRTVSLPFLPCFGKEIFAWSDDWSFTRLGYPAFTVTDTAFYRSDRYHELWDAPGALTDDDYRSFAEVTFSLARMIQRLADQTKP